MAVTFILDTHCKLYSFLYYISCTGWYLLIERKSSDTRSACLLTFCMWFLSRGLSLVLNLISWWCSTGITSATTGCSRGMVLWSSCPSGGWHGLLDGILYGWVWPLLSRCSCYEAVHGEWWHPLLTPTFIHFWGAEVWKLSRGCCWDPVFRICVIFCVCPQQEKW